MSYFTPLFLSFRWEVHEKSIANKNLQGILEHSNGFQVSVREYSIKQRNIAQYKGFGATH